jgi:hypothetical protein
MNFLTPGPTAYSLLQKTSIKSPAKLEYEPLFYYPQTTTPVPIRKMSFFNNITPDPNRYNSRNEHARKNIWKKEKYVNSFFKQSSACKESKEIRYNTLIKKRNMFGVKTGRPTAFLSATPRFNDASEKSIIQYAKSKQRSNPFINAWPSTVTENKNKPLSKAHLEKLSLPKSFTKKKSAENDSVLIKKLMIKNSNALQCEREG